MSVGEIGCSDKSKREWNDHFGTDGVVYTLGVLDSDPLKFNGHRIQSNMSIQLVWSSFSRSTIKYILNL